MIFRRVTSESFPISRTFRKCRPGSDSYSRALPRSSLPSSYYGPPRLRRGVAMKVIDASRGSFPEVRARFLREARIQGQLEHPSVVPVYDMGVDPSGREYFTMKHVAGVTLGNVLGALMSGDRGAEEQFPQ